VEVEDSQLLLHASGRKKVTRVGRERDGAHNVVMLQSVDVFARVGIPYFTGGRLAEVVAQRPITYAVKSAEAVAAYWVSGDSRAW